MVTASSPPSSPCIQVCILDALTGWCVGCGRTIEEIVAWGSMPESDRLGVMAGLPVRLRSLPSERKGI